MLGVPATISTADSTARASPYGRPYSVSQTAIVDAERRRDQRSTSQQQRGADQRVLEAAALGLVERRVGALEEQAEVEVLGALDTPCR